MKSQQRAEKRHSPGRIRQHNPFPGYASFFSAWQSGLLTPVPFGLADPILIVGQSLTAPTGVAPAWEQQSCKGFTWIQAGTYNASDPAMCYLLSAITGRVSARGHSSAVKETAGGTQGGSGPLNGRWTTGGGAYYNIVQKGDTFTWTIEGGNPEKGQGTIGDTVKASWSGPGYAGKGEAKKITRDSNGIFIRLDWDNGVVFTRVQ